MTTRSTAALAVIVVIASVVGVAIWRSGSRDLAERGLDPETSLGRSSPTRSREALRARPAGPEAEPAVHPIGIAVANMNLRGRVVDGLTGRPIAGARVSVVPQSADDRASRAVVETDLAGRFELSAPIGRVLVRAESDGWYQPHFPDEPADLDLWRRGASWFDRNAADVPATGAAEIELRLARTGSVEGRVLLVDGTPVADAEVVVHAASAGAPTTRGRSDREGRFRIPDVPPVPKLWMDATAPGLVAASPVEVVVEAGRSATGVEIRMRRPPTVVGRLTSADGRSLAGASVKLVLATESRLIQWGPHGEWLAWSGVAGSPARADGTYELPIWPARGEFVVRAECPGHQPAESARVRCEDGRERYTVDLTLQRGAALAGRVTAKDSGVGIAGAVVLAGPATNPLATVVAPLRTTSGEDGSFRFDALPPETYVVSASAEGYVGARATVMPATAEAVSLPLARARSIKGIVRLDGRPVANAIVSVQAEADEGLELFDPFVDPFPGAAKTGADGAFTVSGLDAGRYRLHVRPAPGASFRAVFSSPVEAGSSGFVVDVEALSAGEVPEPHAALSNRDLGLSAYQLNMNRDHEASAERWRALLTRPLTRNERAAALLEYASPLGNLGRRDEQEAALREAIDLAGPTLARGLDGLSRLAWSRYWAGDARAAADLIDAVTTSPDVVQAAGARWSAARFVAKLGDVDAARDALTKLRAELIESADSRLRRLLPQIERSLADLSRR